MSRKIILSLVAVGTIAAAGFASDSSYARAFGGGGFGGGHFGGGHFGGGHRLAGGGHFARRGGRLIPVLNPGRPGHPGHWVWHHHDHGHWVFRDGVWIDIDAAVDATPVLQPAAGLCTCLTKTYTPNGLVVFADVCTKEAASAPVDQAADATPAPTSGATAGPISDPTPGPSASPGQAPTADMAKASSADVAKVPTSPNYAGRTYADYLAATQQASQAAAQKN
jgi:hypothetical protein